MFIYKEIYFLCARYNAPKIVNEACEIIRFYKLIMRSPLPIIFQDIIDKIV